MFNSLRRRHQYALVIRQLLTVGFVAFLILQPVAVLVSPVQADTGTGSVSLTTLGTPVAENFNTLATSGTTNTTLPTGWYITEQGGGARDNEQYAADTGGSNTGDTYSYGAASNTERALGGLRSGTLIAFFGAMCTNQTGATITSLDITYTGEQWRLGTAGRADRINFQISTDATDLTTGTYTDVDALDFATPNTSTVGAKDGNATANRTTLTATISSLSLPHGASFFIRWTDLDASGADDGLAIDDFSITPHGSGGGAPPSLSIDDITIAEGNAGPQAGTFTVSLSAPAGPGGVTFDIATQDNTATVADNDYVARSLTGQTIPPGSQTYAFEVTVNGDNTIEPTETFLVNVTNVTGATVADGQGLGTIDNAEDVSQLKIHEIQGSGATSPYVGQEVVTNGIVTGLKTGSSGGYFLQTPDAEADADPNTSEGIFCFTGSNLPAGVAIGNHLRIRSTVIEFRPTQDPHSPPLTELAVATPSFIASNQPLPAPVNLTPAETTAPSETPNPLDTLEEYEGMRVNVASLTVVAPTQGNLNEPNATATSNGVFYGVVTGVARPFREPGIAVSDPVPAPTPPGVPRFDENPERIRVDSDTQPGATAINVPAGTVLTNVVGPLDFAFRAYTILPDAAAPPVPGTLPSAMPVPLPSANEFTVASFNAFHFFDTNDDPGVGDTVLTPAAFNNRLNKFSLVVRNVLRTPDVIGVQEFDNLGTLQAAAARVNNDAVSNGDPNPNYQAYLEEGNDQGGIDVGFLVKSSRVTVISVTQEGKTATYTNPNNGVQETLNDRPPLVLRASIARPAGGALEFTVIVNHLRSLNGVDDPTPNGTGTEGARVRAKRRAGAEFLAHLIQSRQNNDPTERIIVLGDMNAFQFNDGLVDVIGTIKGQPTPPEQVVLASSDLVNPDLTNLVDTLPMDQRYSFSFDGHAQTLDHLLVNDDALAIKNRFVYARNNADFPNIYYADPNRPERITDHDIPVAYFNLAGPVAAGQVIISEYRLRGPDAGISGVSVSPTAAEMSPAANNEFIEFYNNTDSDITVSVTDGSAGWALVASDGVPRFVIPNGTTIPARGHYLATNSLGYSLNNYPAGDNGTADTTATGDIAYPGDIPDQSGLALFSTANPDNFTTAHRLDAVGYSTAPALYREGAGFNADAPGAEISANIEYSFFRDLRGSGLPKDTGDNAADFLSANTQGQLTTIGRMLGAPGPENLSSPVIKLNRALAINLLDQSASGATAPNRVRDTNATGPNATFGTMSIRRTITNHTGAPVTRLRFRIIDITTMPAPASLADVRALSSSDTVITHGGAPLDLRGTTLEQPPTQPHGGGWNSSLSVGFINLNRPLGAGQSVSVQFLLGVEQRGSFRFIIMTEALP